MKDIDAVWKKRAEDEEQVREAVDNLLGILRGFSEDGTTLDAVARLHELIALNMATLERFTRPIPIAPPFPVPVEVFADMSRRFKEYGIPVYLVAQVKGGGE